MTRVLLTVAAVCLLAGTAAAQFRQQQQPQCVGGNCPTTTYVWPNQTYRPVYVYPVQQVTPAQPVVPNDPKPEPKKPSATLVSWRI